MKWIFAILLVSTVLGDTDAMTFEKLGEVSDFLRILYRGQDYMLIGSRNQITNLSLVTMTDTHVYSWLPSEEEKSRCTLPQQDLVGPLEHLCNSVYPRSVQKVTEDRYLICGSNPARSNCRDFNYTIDKQGQGSWQLREVDWIEYHTDDPALPYGWQFNEYAFAQSATPTHPFTELLIEETDNLDYYSATWKDPYKTKVIPIMYKLPRYPRYSHENSTSLSIVTNNKGVLNFDHSFDIPVQPVPIFAHLFSTQSSVYSVFSELAVEVYGKQLQRYARVSRMCRNDPGVGVGAWRNFITFYKTRLVCGSFQEIEVTDANMDINRFLKPNMGFSFDLVAHATDPHISIIGGGKDKIMLAVFNADSAMFNGTAVCAYRMSDIDNMFDNGDILNITDWPHTIRRASYRPLKCNSSRSPEFPGGLENLRTSNLFLIEGAVKPINEFPLFYQFATPYRFTKIAVHYGVEAADGTKYDMIFIGTDDGTLLQLANITGQYELIEERQIFKGEPVREMELVHIGQHERPYLMMNSLRQLKRVGLEKCHRHLNCSECVSVRNPYCSWSHSEKRCVASHHNATDKIQNLITGIDDRCIVEDEINVTMTTDKVTTEKVPETTTATIYVNTQPVKEEAKSSSSLVAGIAVAVALVFGIAGFFAGWFFSRRTQRSPTENLDHLSGSKMKGEKLDADGIGDYHEPKQLNTLNKYSTLNNGTKVILNDTSVNDSTLARQKKSYV